MSSSFPKHRSLILSGRNAEDLATWPCSYRFSGNVSWPIHAYTVNARRLKPHAVEELSAMSCRRLVVLLVAAGLGALILLYLLEDALVYGYLNEIRNKHDHIKSYPNNELGRGSTVTVCWQILVATREPEIGREERSEARHDPAPPGDCS